MSSLPEDGCPDDDKEVLDKTVLDPSDIDVDDNQEQQSHLALLPTKQRECPSQVVSSAGAGAPTRDTTPWDRDRMDLCFRVDKAKPLITIRVLSMSGEQRHFAMNERRLLWELGHLVETAFGIQYDCGETALDLLRGTFMLNWLERRMSLQALGVTDGTSLSFVLRALDEYEKSDVQKCLWNLHMKAVPTQTIRDKASELVSHGLMSTTAGIHVLDAICMVRFPEYVAECVRQSC